MKFHCIQNKIAVKDLHDGEVKTASGLFIQNPDRLEDLAKGLVVSAGPGITEGGKFVPNRIKEGDVVLFNKQNFRAKVGDTNYFFMRDHEVFAIVEE